MADEMRISDVRSDVCCSDLAEVGGRHAVGLVADDQVPLLRCRELLLEFLVPGQDVEADDQAVPVIERIAGARGLDHVSGQDVELEIELLAELVLPLLAKATGRHHQAAVEIAAGCQLLDRQSVVWGKRGSLRVALGGGLIIKKKN